ncbi:hypothetical protein A28LD_0862 [Idiomarina sp. A28L]|uniref:hypothetical protein n=1 Tax=Idiomarina sp. A28L TaxID=1036674 RepID=UPI0002138996|nr:hypothetical protein [Idiomarina sp. A28L]EGN75811.1 hypothetical protein A28LD_0862 [Idiomarina sp. A28L]
MLLKSLPNCSVFSQNGYKTAAIVVILLFLITGCNDKKNINAAIQLCALHQFDEDFNTPSTIVDSNCSFSSSLGDVELRSSDPLMPVEQPISMHLRTPSETFIVGSEITGLSMYMGRIPVIWESIGRNLWQADILLGACTDPKMIWQLEITIAHENEPRGTEKVHISFQSTW